MTTVYELIAQLEQLIEDDERLGDSEVLLVTQPSYPLQFRIGNVVAETQIEDDEFEGDYDEPLPEFDEDNPPVVYITEGGHPHDKSPYGPSAAFN